MKFLVLSVLMFLVDRVQGVYDGAPGNITSLFVSRMESNRLSSRMGNFQESDGFAFGDMNESLDHIKIKMTPSTNRIRDTLICELLVSFA